MTLWLYIASAIVICAHTLLNFTLCKRLSDGIRFHRLFFYVPPLVNGFLAPFVLTYQFENPMTPYFACTAILLFELFITFKGRLAGTFGVAMGSLLHLFVLRSIIVAAMALGQGSSMYAVISDQYISSLANLGAFAAQVVTLTLFITFVPLKILRVVMDSRRFYRGLLMLTCLLNLYIIYNANIFLVDYVSVNLAVQEIVIALFALGFFYIMMLSLIQIFKLGIFEEKSKELEVQIDKDKMLTATALQSAEMIIEINCSQDKLKRIFIKSVERATEHLPKPHIFFDMQSSTYTHPDDSAQIKKLTAIANLIANFEARVHEQVLEYRSKRINAQDAPTGVQSVGDEYLWYRMRVNLSRDHETADIIALLTVDDIDAEKQAELQLRRQAETDPLTGGYNRAAFARKVNAHLSSGGRGTLYMFDLDNFKGINDNMGHMVGDDVLREIYAKTSALFRENDLVGRLGGDEFIIFMMGTIKQSLVESKAAQICTTLTKTYRADNGAEIEITGSVGIALAPQDGGDFETLLHAADVAMYRSKNAGKNRFTIYDASMPAGFEPRSREDYTRTIAPPTAKDDE